MRWFVIIVTGLVAGSTIYTAATMDLPDGLIIVGIGYLLSVFGVVVSSRLEREPE